MQQSYSKVFYAWQRIGSHNSAKRILPIVFDAVHPKTVVDVGCGVGTWLDVARSLGASTVGYEGEWVKSCRRPIPASTSAPPTSNSACEPGQTFDLAISMEVAEHLSPSAPTASSPISWRWRRTCCSAPRCPGRAATTTSTSSGRATGPTASPPMATAPRDIVRPAVRDDRRVAYWYRQNAVLYSKGFVTQRAPGFDQVHPEHTAWYRLIHRRLTSGLKPGTIFRPS